MSCGQAVLITGITGTLGSWLARAALDDGLHVCALARAKGSRSASERVRHSAAAAGAVDLHRLSVVEGDLLEPRLGLQARVPENIKLILHCAACTDFGASSAQRSQRTNVQGVQHVLEFAAQRRLPLAHVSTAYVSGRRAGRVMESELDVRQGFNNVYERTKCEGEAVVHRWAKETGLPTIILRPGIVAGAWQTGHIGCFNAFYDFMHAVDVLKLARARQLRMVAHPDVTKNIIPVDYFVQVAWRILRRRVAGTFHITHPRPLTLAQLARMFCEVFDMDHIDLMTQQQWVQSPTSRAERICHRGMAPYRPYLVAEEPTFDRSNTDAALAGGAVEAPPIDAAYFARILNYARRVNWGRESKPSTPVAEYFEVFLPQKVGTNLLPNLRKLTARFGIALREDPASAWVLDVRQGVLETVSRSTNPTDCHYTVDAPTFVEIVAGRLSPQLAFFQRRVSIGGDVATGLKTAVILAQFFRQYPFVSANV